MKLKYVLGQNRVQEVSSPKRKAICEERKT
jgi:hypothetical protein